MNETDEWHDAKTVFDLFACDSTGMSFTKRLSTVFGIEFICVCEREREREKTYTRSVHCISFLRFFILRRRSGARTSNTHLSVSWSAIDLRSKRSFFSSRVGFFLLG